MLKIRINPPGDTMYTTDLIIRVDDINYAGHLSNDRILTLAHDARIRMLNHYGLSELDIGGAGMIMVDAAVQFLSEGFHGDTIRAGLSLTNWRNSGFDMIYHLFNLTSGKDLAYVQTGLIAFDNELKKVRRLPVSFKEKFKPQ